LSNQNNPFGRKGKEKKKMKPLSPVCRELRRKGKEKKKMKPSPRTESLRRKGKEEKKEEKKREGKEVRND
jgi:hypothetical protein